MTSSSTDSPRVAHRNEVVLRGRVSADPETRILPSGDVLVTFRLVVQRDARALKGSKQTVDVIECAAWTSRLRQRAARLRPGAEVEVSGALRRRFSRRAGGLTSHVSVELAAVTVSSPGRR
ncbi:hypothetical protein GCM10009821_02820 [Aeromicrobium halocynthiae]|uniref:Single-stranded DNA-binding protein n=1 Tax=Aeromicrobium halocynthiae TaxID=560557 RepID=A0ABN2VST7_9ACTN